MAARLVPSRAQLAWQECELVAFLHFGMNTFTGREWGDGTENPAWFQPDSLDCDQWAEVLASSGFKMAMLTAKHHDGFCLWPTETTEHSVANSGWTDGETCDVVKLFTDACRRHGLKVGLYLSPWDRNAPCYGDSPAYNDFFVAQLTELLTNYGEIDEVWFDGACGEGPNGKVQEYDRPRFANVVHTLQPNAVAALQGGDVRWVGNENGMGRETEWSSTVLLPQTATVLQEGFPGDAVKTHSPGSRELVGKAMQMFWFPSEVDVSIRPGWFYHEEEDGAVKSLEHLKNIYFSSVGMNSLLLLNIPPDKHGRISRPDVERLQEFNRYLTDTFSDDLVAKRKGLEVSVRPGAGFNIIMLQEDITKGQRVESFTVDAFDGKAWKTIAQGTTIGYKRLLRVPGTTAEKVRLTVTSSRAEPVIGRIGLYTDSGYSDR